MFGNSQWKRNLSAIQYSTRVFMVRVVLSILRGCHSRWDYLLELPLHNNNVKWICAYFGERKCQWLIFSYFHLGFNACVRYLVLERSRPICALNRSWQLRNLKLKYKYTSLQGVILSVVVAVFRFLNDRWHSCGNFLTIIDFFSTKLRKKENLLVTTQSQIRNLSFLTSLLCHYTTRLFRQISPKI